MDDLIKRLHLGKSCYIGTAASQLTAVDEYGLLCLEVTTALAEAQATIARQQVMLDRAMESNGDMMVRIGKLEEALAPSGETKAAYMGEIKDPETKRTVSWTAIKMVMAMISDRAALAQGKGE